ncbi:MAG: nucleotidyltransferase family protein [Pseudonocardiaceae bacterium]
MSDIRIFGSVARGEADERSDLDLLVSPRRRIGNGSIHLPWTGGAGETSVQATWRAGSTFGEARGVSR